MRIYQDKLGIYTESDLKSQQETLEDPLLARLGIGKQPELEQLNKKDFNYLLPLLVAYKHKLSMLDKHLTERYKQVVRKNNDLENQLEIKQKLITQIDNKQQEALNIAGSIDPLNADYSSMDFISQTDLVHQINTLNDSNQRAIDLLDGLSSEESSLIKAIGDITREIAAARAKHSKLETDTITHRISSINRNLTIMGEKQL